MAAAHKERSRLHAALQVSVNHIFEALSYLLKPRWVTGRRVGLSLCWIAPGAG
jgi:hypothetical protein